MQIIQSQRDLSESSIAILPPDSTPDAPREPIGELVVSIAILESLKIFFRKK
jgi:hypothetical protein